LQISTATTPELIEIIFNEYFVTLLIIIYK